MNRLSFVAMSCLLGMGSLCAAESIGWRTDGSGSYQVDKAPTKWSDTDNAVWRQKMPAWSNTSPIIIGDKIFTCAEPATLLCLNKKDGSILWQANNHYKDVADPAEADKIDAALKEATPIFKELESLKRKIRSLRKQARKKDGNNDNARVEMEKLLSRQKELNEKIEKNEIAKKYREPSKHGANGYCSYIPVSDGQHIYVAYGLGTISCFDLNGKRIWSVLGQKPSQGWGGSTSPVLAGEVVVVGLKDYIAYDKKTGTEKWRVAVKNSYGSPIVVRIGNDDVIITPQGVALNAKDGSVIDDNLFTPVPYNAPIVHDGVIYAVGARDSECAAVKIPDSMTGEFEQLWKTTVEKNRYYSSPLFHDGLLYVLHRSGALSAINPADGSVVNSVNVKGMKGNSVYTSPTYAAGHIYIGDEAGLVVVFEAGKDLKEVARNKQEGTRCNPVFEGDKMYMRTNNHMLCIQAP